MFLSLVWNIHVIQMSKSYKIYTLKSLVLTLLLSQGPTQGALQLIILVVGYFHVFFVQIREKSNIYSYYSFLTQKKKILQYHFK